ncbi:hypothetical protein P8452_05735 [Trifolium repens]|nr:hypothetical protein P8452_05735 [Trifolium repens]
MVGGWLEAAEVFRTTCSNFSFKPTPLILFLFNAFYIHTLSQSHSLLSPLQCAEEVVEAGRFHYIIMHCLRIPENETAFRRYTNG